MQLLQYLSDLVFLAAYVGCFGAFSAPLSMEQERMYVERMLSGDDDARKVLIEHNLRLVAHIAKKYIKAGRDSDDVISVGTIGLIKAVSTYDPTKGVSLAGYAGRCVENEILMRIRAERRQVSALSLMEPIGTDSDGNDVLLADIIGTEPDIVVNEVDRRIDAAHIGRALKERLTKRERTVVVMRFGLYGGNRATQREVAELMGISRSYVSRIEKKALSKLHDALARTNG